MLPPDAPRPHAVFRWGGERFALDVSGVQEVVADLNLTPLPRAGAGWLGVANLRGEILPAVSLQRWFAGAAAAAPTPVFLIVRTPAGRLALAVESVAGVSALPPAGTSPPEGEPEFVTHRWQPPDGETPVRCLDAARLAQKLRELFVLSTLPPA